MNARLTYHAREQITSRGITTDSEVLDAVNQRVDQVSGSKSWEVKVVVKRLEAKVYCPDGSNGDVVVACVDPKNLAVKTVMLQRAAQVARKSQFEDYL